MTKAMFPRGPGRARRQAGALTGEISYRADGKKATTRTWRPAQFAPALAAWFAAAADGDQVEVIVDVDGDGQAVQVRMARPPALIAPAPDPVRLDAVARLGGQPNPYTFIPTPPRRDLPDSLGDGMPAPHGVIDPARQWSGWLALRLVARTPMLLPDPEHAERGPSRHPMYPVRVGPDGKPLLHGASVKGALRSAYEAVTNSRYAVFRGHGQALAYRRPASSQDRPSPEPARLGSDGRGGLEFRLCDAIPVPLYQPLDGRPAPSPAEAVGEASEAMTLADGTANWRQLHGARVTCVTRDIEPRPDRRRDGRPSRRPGQKRTVVAEVALAGDEASLRRSGQRKTGWLSVTGHSIATKTSERLFVPRNDRTVPVTQRHHQMWHAVLASYQEAAAQRADEPGAGVVEQSRHIVADAADVPDQLTEGDLVYLERDRQTREVTAISPVYIGRLPYPTSPGQLLDPSLHPAASLAELSPADRLFGWAPQRFGPSRASASGYRGRIRIAPVRCDATDWMVADPDPGITIGPLSSPKPTQFRFYSAADPAGSPVTRGVPKGEGYRGGGLRGRKAYWYPAGMPDDYWMPGTGTVNGMYREWQEPAGAARSQTSTHKGWVKAGTEFMVRLFLDAVPADELGPLIWIASQDGCPLRLGAGKPYGFGAVTVSIDWTATELRTGDALLGCWSSLQRPDPCPDEKIQALAEQFERQATGNPALAPCLAAFRAIAQGLDKPAGYPRTQREPEAETYRWFVANEQITDGDVEHGFALPHVLEENQDLPRIRPRQR